MFHLFTLDFKLTKDDVLTPVLSFEPAFVA